MSQIQINKQVKIKELLQIALSENKISSWKIHSYKKNRSNIYVEKGYQIESILNSIRNESQITITKDLGDNIGENSFSISEAISAQELEKELKDSIFSCSYSKSKKYENIKSSDKEIDDSNINYENYYSSEFIDDFNSGNLNLFVSEKLEILKKIVESYCEEKIKLKLNSFEFHNSIYEGELESSNNIKKASKKTHSYMEFVLTAINTTTNKETEHITYEKISDIYSYDFENFFKQAANFVLDTAIESKAQDFKGKIILSGIATKDFFTPDLGINSILVQTLARMKYYGLTKFEIGDTIVNAKYDKLTIYSNPLLGSNLSSLPYDDDGVSARKLCLIKDNVLENLAASNKFAKYLNVKPTGPLGPFEINLGNKSYNDLVNDSDKQIEIVTFASFSPDMSSGDFSAEIRLGYIIENGEKTPFKGGLFTGNIFKLLEEVELSNEELNTAGYIGPKTIKFHKANLVGL